MSKPNQIQRSPSELFEELGEQLQLLKAACRSYDSGLEASGKHIAVSLRLLLHNTSKSHSLLGQLGLLDKELLDSAGPLSPSNLLSECNLVLLAKSKSGGRYAPLVFAGDSPLPMRKVSFTVWWTEPILKDNSGRKFSRRDLVQHVADTDGGAHVDPGLDEAYLAFSRANSLGWVFEGSGINEAFKGRPELACMRQIAHEVLTTLEEVMPKL